MPRLSLTAVVFAALLLGAASARGEGQSSGALELFNGKDLSGWTHYLREPNAKRDDVWSIKDGELICTGKPSGYLRTLTPYADYELTVEWRWTGEDPEMKRNSGVLVHTQEPDTVWPKSIEVQLGSGNAGDFWVIGGTTLKVPDMETRTMGRRTKNLSDGSEKPLGQWNQMVVTCRKDEITVKVNGELVNHATALSVSKGTICLQSEGAEIHFRTVRLVPVAP